MNTIDIVVNFFQSAAQVSKAEASQIQDIDFVERTSMDSMQFVSFISAIEDHFGLQFTQEDFEGSNLKTLASIARTLDSRTSAHPSKRNL